MSDNENKTIAPALIGTGAIASSKNMILGKKTMYHGTSSSNWDKIKSEGLRSEKGGIGGAGEHIGNKQYINSSKNTVHLTRAKPVANMYSNMGNSENPGLQSMFRQGKDGKTIKVNMDYDKFKKMKIDNVGSDDISDIPKIFRPAAKNMAAKGNINISPEEIVGSNAARMDKVKHTMKALPSYIKNNPARFGAGLALAGAGAYGIHKSFKDKNANYDYKEQIEKTAINATKARAMAMEAGIFPVGNWKSALRSIRDTSGNLLKGKELADAKGKLGALKNNSYQTLKKYNRKYTSGGIWGDNSVAGTELGAIVSNDGKLNTVYGGKRGGGGVNHNGNDFFGGNRIMHTHPQVGSVSRVSEARKRIKHSTKALEDAKNKYKDSGLIVGDINGPLYNDAKLEAKNNMIFHKREINGANENLARFSGKRNPLLVEPSGLRSNELFRKTNGDKNKINHIKAKVESGISEHNNILHDVNNGHRNGSMSLTDIDNHLKSNSDSMINTLLSESARNEYNTGFGRSGDLKGWIDRSGKSNKKVTDNILSPELDLEGIHKTKTMKYDNGDYKGFRMKSVYLDRSPRKIRQEKSKKLYDLADSIKSQNKDVTVSMRGTDPHAKTSTKY